MGAAIFVGELGATAKTRAQAHGRRRLWWLDSSVHVEVDGSPRIKGREMCLPCSQGDAPCQHEPPMDPALRRLLKILDSRARRMSQSRPDEQMPGNPWSAAQRLQRGARTPATSSQVLDRGARHDTREAFQPAAQRAGIVLRSPAQVGSRTVSQTLISLGVLRLAIALGQRVSRHGQEHWVRIHAMRCAVASPLERQSTTRRGLAPARADSVAYGGILNARTAKS